MPKFYYIARDNTGKKIMGSEEASSSDELVGRLQARNLIVINVLLEPKEGGVATKSKTMGVRAVRRHYRVTSTDLVLFCRQLATLLGAGVTILKSLDITSKQVSSRKFYNVIKDLVKNMEAGLSFHEAVSKHPAVFSELWVNLIESGEGRHCNLSESEWK